MNFTCQVEMLCTVLGPACDCFESLIIELYSEENVEIEHGDMESLISRRGMELMRQLMQAWLDIRALRERGKHDVRGADGNLLPHCRENCARKLATIFGDVTVKRKGCSRAGVESPFPLDGELNLAKDKYSHGLRSRVAEESAIRSFDETVANTGKTTGGKVPKRQTQQVVVSAAQDFDAFYSRLLLESGREKQSKKDGDRGHRLQPRSPKTQPRDDHGSFVLNWVSPRVLEPATNAFGPVWSKSRKQSSMPCSNKPCSETRNANALGWSCWMALRSN